MTSCLKMVLKSWDLYLSELIYFSHFNMRHPVSCKIFQNVLKILRMNPKSAHCALEEDRKNNARADRARAKSITSDTADTLDWAVYFVYKCIRIFLAKCIRIPNTSSTHFITSLHCTRTSTTTHDVRAFQDLYSIWYYGSRSSTS